MQHVTPRNIRNAVCYTQKCTVLHPEMQIMQCVTHRNVLCYTKICTVLHPEMYCVTPRNADHAVCYTCYTETSETQKCNELHGFKQHCKFVTNYSSHIPTIPFIPSWGFMDSCMESIWQSGQSQSVWGPEMTGWPGPFDLVGWCWQYGKRSHRFFGDLWLCDFMHSYVSDKSDNQINQRIKNKSIPFSSDWNSAIFRHV